MSGDDHSGGGAPPWFKLFPSRLMGDARVARLEERDRGRLVSLWCLQADGHTPTTDAKLVASLLRITPKQLAATTKRLQAEGLLRADFTSPMFEDMQRVRDPKARERMRRWRARQHAPVTETVTAPVTLRTEDRRQKTEGPAAGAFTALVAAGPAPSQDSMTVGRAAAPPGCPEGPGRGAELRNVVDNLAARAAIRRN